MNNEELDFSMLEADAKSIATSSDSQLKAIAELANETFAIETEIEGLEEKIKELKQRRDSILTSALPDIMDSVGLRDFSTNEGVKISVEDVAYVGIPKPTENQAFSWLREHDLGDIIKNTITCSFGKGEDKMAVALETRLKDMGFAYERKESIHPQTLKSFGKDQIKKENSGLADVKLPRDIFSVHETREAKLKLPRKESKRGKES